MFHVFSGVAQADFRELVAFDEIKKISPNARDEFVQVLVNTADEFDEAGINTRIRLAHFLTQVMTETGGLTRLDENMNYSYETLLRVFSRKIVTEQQAKAIAGDPIKVANWVYGNRLGNRGRHTNDGYNYRGSGFVQLTGRWNFRNLGNELKLPLEDHPELARQAREGLLAAIAYWRSRDINRVADENDLRQVRILVNGPAAHGYEASQVWFNRAWTRVFRDKENAAFELAQVETDDEIALFDDIMRESGLISNEALESGEPRSARSKALRDFQSELGLPVTGELDAMTREALLDPREWRYRDEAAARPTSDFSQTVVFELEREEVVGQEAGSVLSLPAVPGTEEVLADVNMRRETAAFFDSARSIYADYEMKEYEATVETFVPFSKFGEDTRLAINDASRFPSAAIVQILFRTQSGRSRLCSGAMVSNDTVLTAAHCLHSGTKNGRHYKAFRVLPGRSVLSTPYGECRGIQTYLLRGWIDAADAYQSRNFDLGALKLDCEVGKRTGFLGVRVLADHEFVLKHGALNRADDGEAFSTTVQGYASDKADGGQQQRSEGPLLDLQELKGFYQNDTYGGTSGAPVFETSAPTVIIGVHTNGKHGSVEPWSENNAFTRITPERFASIRSWISF